MKGAVGLGLVAVVGAVACASTAAPAPAPKPAGATVAPAPAAPAMTAAPPPAARVAAFSVGHGERASARGGSTDDRYTVTGLREILRKQTFEVRTIGGAGGLGAEIPAEISLLLIIGPQQPFQAGELTALDRFVARGGRLLLALDPENKIDLHQLLGPLGVTFFPELLANEDTYAKRNRRDDDRTNLVTATFPPGAPLPTLARLAGRGALIFPGAGRLELAGKAPPGVSVQSAVKAHVRTFVDRNGNFRFDPGEEQGAFDLAAAATKAAARVFVVADSDALSDLGIPDMPGNSFLAIDALDWLAPSLSP